MAGASDHFGGAEVEIGGGRCYVAPMLGALMMAAAVAAASDGQLLAGGPRWQRPPSVEDARRFYPRKAFAEGVAGQVVVGCRIAADGRLTSCAVIRETPEGWGFGEAALKVAAEARVSPSRQWSLKGAKIQVPIRFDL